VICDAEIEPPSERIVPGIHPAGSRHGRAVCEAAVALAETAQAHAIVAVTRAGHTARLLSSLRPSTEVFAATMSPDVVGACSILWGVTPLLTAAGQLDELERILVERGLVRSGAVGVFVNVSDELDLTDANFVNLQRFA
jgi:pyruvate kinase